jgi:hypothetical protein
LCAVFSVHSWISGNGMKYLGKFIGLVTSFLFEQQPTALYEAAWCYLLPTLISCRRLSLADTTPLRSGYAPATLRLNRPDSQ